MKDGDNIFRVLVTAAGVAVAGGAFGAEFDCVIEPRQTVDIRAAVEGLIERVHVDRGDVVKAGQVLVSLDAGLERASAELARYRSTMNGTIRTAQNRIEYADLKLHRREQLAKENYISAQDRDEAVTEKKLAESQLLEANENRRVAEMEYRRASEQLRLRTLMSPINGVVVERFMNPGELADNRDLRKPAMRLADISVLHVEVLLPLEAYGKVAAGANVEVLPEAPVGGRYSARVKVADRVMDAASGTFGVRLELPNPRLALPAGIKCRANFPGLSAGKSSTEFRRRGEANDAARTRRP